MRYRLNIDIGAVFTSASYEGAEESGALQLSPFARDLPSAQFLADGKVQVNPLAGTLRGSFPRHRTNFTRVPTSVGELPSYLGSHAASPVMGSTGRRNPRCGHRAEHRAAGGPARLMTSHRSRRTCPRAAGLAGATRLARRTASVVVAGATAV